MGYVLFDVTDAGYDTALLVTAAPVADPLIRCGGDASSADGTLASGIQGNITY